MGRCHAFFLKVLQYRRVQIVGSENVVYEL